MLSGIKRRLPSKSRSASTAARLLVSLVVLLLTSCTLPGAQSQAISRVSPPLEPVGLYSLRGDPDFDPNQLPGETQLWHARLWEGIDYLNAKRESQINPDNLAASGDLYAVGRAFNTYITTLLNALRVTKDLALLDEVDRLLEIARAQLGDTNGDGYFNLRYLNENATVGVGQTQAIDFATALAVGFPLKLKRARAAADARHRRWRRAPTSR